MKKILYIVSGVLGSLVLGGVFLANATCIPLTAVFPTSLDTFTTGNCVPSNWSLFIEQKMGINQSTATSSLDYQINHIFTSYGSEVVSSTAIQGFYGNYYSVDNTPQTSIVSLVSSATYLLYPYPITSPIQANKITLYVSQKDVSSTDTYDIGLYDSSGNLVANVGATSTWTTATGTKTMSFKQGLVTFPSGKYYLGWTGVSTTMQLATGLQRFMFYSGATMVANPPVQSVGLNATSALSADNYTQSAIPSIVLHQ